MSIFSLISEELKKWSRPVEVGSYIVVPTFSLYPSNGVVQVFIEGGERTFVASDGGGALDVVLGAGGHNLKSMRLLKEVASKYGLSVGSAGWIHSKPSSIENLVSTISTVADASKMAAETMLRHFQPKRHADFRRDLERYLEISFRNKLEKRGRLLGASNTPQVFDYVINASSVDKIVIDAVVPEPNSINASIVSHIDLKNAHLRGVRQFIVYDESRKWKASDLSLLRVGATPVEYSKFPGSLERIAVL